MTDANLQVAEIVQKGGAVFQHCCAIYSAMEAESTDATIDGRRVKLYEGFVTHLFHEQSFTNAYYSQVMNELRRMDCVMNIRRGGGKSPSRWALLKTPTYELYKELGGRDYKSGGPKSSSNLATMTDMYRDMAGKVSELHEKYGTMSSAMLSMYGRIEDLEKQVYELLQVKEV